MIGDLSFVSLVSILPDVMIELRVEPLKLEISHDLEHGRFTVSWRFRRQEVFYVGEILISEYMTSSQLRQALVIHIPASSKVEQKEGENV